MICCWIHFEKCNFWTSLSYNARSMEGMLAHLNFVQLYMCGHQHQETKHACLLIGWDGQYSPWQPYCDLTRYAAIFLINTATFYADTVYIHRRKCTTYQINVIEVFVIVYLLSRNGHFQIQYAATWNNGYIVVEPGNLAFSYMNIGTPKFQLSSKRILLNWISFFICLFPLFSFWTFL